MVGSGIRDPGSGKNLFRIPDPGGKKVPDPGSGSATLVINIKINLMYVLVCPSQEYLWIRPCIIAPVHLDVLPVKRCGNLLMKPQENCFQSDMALLEGNVPYLTNRHRQK
jgi:hypothetical protein